LGRGEAPHPLTPSSALKHPVILTRQAEGNIAEAFDYYEAKRENFGFEFIGRVEQAIKAISEHPLSHRRLIEDVRRAIVVLASVLCDRPVLVVSLIMSQSDVKEPACCHFDSPGMFSGTGPSP
jgi:hypothetical protein